MVTLKEFLGLTNAPKLVSRKIEAGFWEIFWTGKAVFFMILNIYSTSILYDTLCVSSTQAQVLSTISCDNHQYLICQIF